jgi:hypothetical protein
LEPDPEPDAPEHEPDEPDAPEHEPDAPEPDATDVDNEFDVALNGLVK